MARTMLQVLTKEFNKNTLTASDLNAQSIALFSLSAEAA